MKRQQTGIFKPECNCFAHDPTFPTHKYLINLSKRKKISTENYEKLLNNGTMNVDRGNGNICKHCLKKIIGVSSDVDVSKELDSHGGDTGGDCTNDYIQYLSKKAVQLG